MVKEKPEQMSWGGYKPDKNAWMIEGFGDVCWERNSRVGGTEKDQVEADLCAQLVWGPCRAVAKGVWSQLKVPFANGGNDTSVVQKAHHHWQLVSVMEVWGQFFLNSPIHDHLACPCPPIHMPTCLPSLSVINYSFFLPSIHLPIHPFFYISTCLSILTASHLPNYPCVHAFIHPPNCP